MADAPLSIGYHDDPLFRKVSPPQAVWVNLAAAYPLPEKDGYVPGGLDLLARVPGTLHIWAVTTSGTWVGWITYDTPTMRGVTGWVVAPALEPRNDQPTRRGTSRGRSP